MSESAKTAYIGLLKVKTTQGEQVHLVDHFPVQLGRATDADVILVEPSASRKHAKLHFQENPPRFQVEDLASANGTFLDSQKLNAGQLFTLTAESRLTFGRGQDIYQIQIIPRPVQLADLESQQKTWRSNLNVIMDEMRTKSRLTLEQQLQREMQNKKNELEHILQTELNQKLQAWMESEKKRFEADFNEKNRLAVEQWTEQMEQEKRILREKIQRDEQQLKERLAKTEAERLEILEKDLEERRRQFNQKWDKDKADAKSEFDKQILNLTQQRDYLLESKNVADQATHEAKQRVREMEIKLSPLTLQVEGLEHELSQKREELKTLSEQALLAERKAAMATKDAFAKLNQQEQEMTARSHALLQEAQTQVWNATATAREKSEQLLQQAREKAEALQEQTQKEVQDLRAKAILQSEQFVQESRAKTQAQQQAVFEQLEKDLETKRQQRMLSLDKELSGLTERRNQLQGEFDRESAAFLDLRKNHEALVAEHESTIKNVNEANAIIQESKEAVLTSQKAKADVEGYKNELNKLRTDWQVEQHELNEKAQAKKSELLLQFEDQKRDQDKKLAEQRLKALNAWQAEMQEGEKHYQEQRFHQAAELARTLQIRMIDRLQADVRDPEKIAGLTNDLFHIAKTVLTEDRKDSPTQFQIASTNQKKEPEAKSPTPVWTLIGVTVAVCGLIVWFWPEISNRVHQSDKNSFATQMIEQRKIQSLYQPPQDDKYRDNETDNILYNRRYAKLKSTTDYQTKWTLRLNDLELIKSLKVTEDRMVQIQASQNALRAKLIELRPSIDAVYLEEGIGRLRKTEAEEKAHQIELLGSAQKLQRLQEVEREFFQSYAQAHPTDDQ